jgi:hypothetical protein
VNTTQRGSGRLWILGVLVAAILVVGVALVQGESTTSPTTSGGPAETQPASEPTTIALAPGSLQPVIGIENNDGKRVVIGGVVSSEEEKATLIAEAQTAFPGLTVVTSGVLVDALVRPMADITTLFGALSQVQAPMSFTSSSETTYTVRGTVANEASKVAVFTGVAAGIGIDQNAVVNQLSIR